MEDVLKFLQEVDLSEIEGKLYLNLLKNGPISVRDLAETIAIKRTTAYFYIDQLIEKGLAYKLIKGSKKLVAANPPEKLERLVNKKVSSAKAVEQNYAEILQTLTSTYPQTKNKSDAEIKYYKSTSAINDIYEEALNSNELRSYIKLIEAENAFPNNVSLINDAFKKNDKLIIKELFYDTPASRQEALKIASINDRYSYKFLPKDMNLSSEDILIYDGKVAIIHYKDKRTSTCVVLQSLEYYNNSKELFDFIWKLIPDNQ